MDVNIGETPAGRLKMELFSDIVPKFVLSPDLALSINGLNKDTGLQRTSGSYVLESSGRRASFMSKKR